MFNVNNNNSKIQEARLSWTHLQLWVFYEAKPRKQPEFIEQSWLPCLTTNGTIITSVVSGAVL